MHIWHHCTHPAPAQRRRQLWRRWSPSGPLQAPSLASSPTKVPNNCDWRRVGETVALCCRILIKGKGGGAPYCGTAQSRSPRWLPLRRRPRRRRLHGLGGVLTRRSTAAPTSRELQA